MSALRTTTSSRTRSSSASHCCRSSIVKYSNYMRRTVMHQRPAVTIRKETAMSSEAGPPQANAALAVESIEAFNAGDTERLLSVMAPDFVMHLAEFPEPLGRDAWR